MQGAHSDLGVPQSPVQPQKDDIRLCTSLPSGARLACSAPHRAMDSLSRGAVFFMPLPFPDAISHGRRLRMDPDAYDIHVFHPEAPLPPYDDEDEEDWEAPPQAPPQAHDGCSELEIFNNTACHTFCHTSIQGDRCDGTCAICLDNFKDGDSVRALRCLHTFHTDCVDKWLSGNRLCPICKQDIAGELQATGRERNAEWACSASSASSASSEEEHAPENFLDISSRLTLPEVRERSSAILSLHTLTGRLYSVHSVQSVVAGPFSQLRPAVTVFHRPHDMIQPPRSGRIRRVRRSTCIIAL